MKSYGEIGSLIRPGQSSHLDKINSDHWTPSCDSTQILRNHLSVILIWIRHSPANSLTTAANAVRVETRQQSV